jgi:hypothetical protein
MAVHKSINPIAGMVHRSSHISGAALDRSLESQDVLENPNAAIVAAQALVDGAIASTESSAHWLSCSVL